MRKWALVITMIAAIFGGALSLLSTSQHLRIQREGLIEESFCAISEMINCDIVNASSYSEFLGVPIAWWGLLFYLTLLGISVIALLSKKGLRSSVAIGWFMAVGSILYSIFLGYISFFILKVLCIECLGMYLANILLFIFFFIALEVPPRQVFNFIGGYVKAVFGKPSGLGFRPRIIPNAIVIGIVFLIGWIMITNVEAKHNKGKADIKIDELVKTFYQQSLYDIKVDPKWAVWGNPDAKVTIVEFSEYQCPFCKMSAFNVKPYLQQYKDDVRYFFVHYPLDTACNDQMTRQMHPLACFSSKAAMCADKRGGFWSFHDELFRNQRKLTKDSILKLAVKRGWDEKEFLACIESPETDARVKKELAEGHRIYISGTPTLFLNNRKLRYWKSPEFVREVMKREIKKSKKQ